MPEVLELPARKRLGESKRETKRTRAGDRPGIGALATQDVTVEILGIIENRADKSYWISATVNDVTFPYRWTKPLDKSPGGRAMAKEIAAKFVRVADGLNRLVGKTVVVPDTVFPPLSYEVVFDDNVSNVFQMQDPDTIALIGTVTGAASPKVVFVSLEEFLSWAGAHQPIADIVASRLAKAQADTYWTNDYLGSYEGTIVIDEGGGGTPPPETLTATIKVWPIEVTMLNTNPYTLVQAPGVGMGIKFLGAEVAYDFETTPYTLVGIESLATRYTNKTGLMASSGLPALGLLDQTADATGTITATPDVTPPDNAPLMLHMWNFNVTGGDSPITVVVSYQVLPTPVPAVSEVTLDPTFSNVPAAGGSGSFAVAITTVGVDNTWQVTKQAGADWLTVDSPPEATPQSGDGTVNYTAAANTTAAELVGELYVNGKTHTVRVAPTAGETSVTLDMAQQNFPAYGMGTAGAMSNSVTVTMVGSGTWQVTMDPAAPWLTAVYPPADTPQAANGIFTYSAAANDTATERTGVITINDKTHTAIEAAKPTPTVTPVPVDAATILAMSTTPKVLVALPPASSAHQFQGAVATFTFATAAYVDAGGAAMLEIRSGSTVVSDPVSAAFLLAAVSGGTATFVPKAGVLLQMNQPLTLAMTGGSLTGGDGSMSVEVTYATHSYPL